MLVKLIYGFKVGKKYWFEFGGYVFGFNYLLFLLLF